MVANRPTQAQAQEFDGYVRKWQAILSLGDWRIERVPRPAKQAMASVEFNDPARLVTYRLGDWGAESITSASLEATAVHELLHVLIHDLIVTAQDPKTSDEQLEAVEHRVINVLERVLTKE